MMKETQNTERRGQAPGKSHRKGLTFFELAEMFPTEEAARKWFEEARWGKTRCCPHCGGTRKITEPPNAKPMPYHCGACRGYFSVRTGGVMQRSRLPLRTWAIALFLMASNLKGISSMRLHRELGITQKSAWLLSQKIREAFKSDPTLDGEVEIDEAFFGGLEANKHESKRLHLGRGSVGKAAVVAAKQRGGKVKAEAVSDTTARTLLEFADKSVLSGSKIYTDDNPAYSSLPTMFNRFFHDTVKHSVGEYVKENAHTNGVESFWALLKRGYNGTFHHVSAKHLGRYVAEFAGRHNIRELDTAEQMAELVRGMVGKKLTWAEVVA